LLTLSSTGFGALSTRSLAQAGEGADLFDDLDLLVTGGGQDDVELALLLFGGRRVGTAAGRGRGHRHGSGRGDAEALLEVLQ
jgi:hypothetical protein